MIIIMLASKSDEKYIKAGIDFLAGKTDFEIWTDKSCHRYPEGVGLAVDDLRKIYYSLENGKRKKITAVIATAATMTGLPGVLAGYLLDLPITVIGVRIEKNPQGHFTEDGSASLSAMPSGVPVIYAGFNEKGFLHACMAAFRIDYHTTQA